MDAALNEKYRQAAQESAAKLAQLPQTRYVLLIGSVADGTADEFSDIDLMVLYHDEPSEEDIEVHVAKRSVRKFRHDEFHFDVHGITDGGGAMFTPGDRIERFVHAYPDVSFAEYGELSRYIVYGQILHGDGEEFAAWREQCMAVPTEMKRDTTYKEMASLNFWFRKGHLLALARRADWIMVNRTLNESILGILRVVYLLNDRIMIKPKRTRVELDQCAIKPRDLSLRLEELYLLQNTLPDVEGKVAEVVRIMDELKSLVESDPLATARKE